MKETKTMMTEKTKTTKTQLIGYIYHLRIYISPFKNHPPSVDEIKQKAQGIKENSTSLKMKKNY